MRAEQAEWSSILAVAGPRPKRGAADTEHSTLGDQREELLGSTLDHTSVGRDSDRLVLRDPALEDRPETNQVIDRAPREERGEDGAIAWTLSEERAEIERRRGSAGRARSRR